MRNAGMPIRWEITTGHLTEKVSKRTIEENTEVQTKHFFVVLCFLNVNVLKSATIITLSYGVVYIFVVY